MLLSHLQASSLCQETLDMWHYQSRRLQAMLFTLPWAMHAFILRQCLLGADSMLLR